MSETNGILSPDTGTNGDVDMFSNSIESTAHATINGLRTESLETPASPLAPTPHAILETPIPATTSYLENGLQSGAMESASTPPGIVSTPAEHLSDLEDAAVSAAGAAPGTFPDSTVIPSSTITTTANNMTIATSHPSLATAGLTSTTASPSKAQSPAPFLTAGGVASPARGSTPVPGSATNNLPPSAIIPPRDGTIGSPTRAYINTKITPVMLEGMRWVAKNEPEKPLKWLGEFLLKRSAELEGS